MEDKGCAGTCSELSLQFEAKPLFTGYDMRGQQDERLPHHRSGTRARRHAHGHVGAPWSSVHHDTSLRRIVVQRGTGAVRCSALSSGGAWCRGE